MAIRKKVWTGIRNRLQGLALGITGRKINVNEIPSGSDELAYTMKGNNIFLNPNHSMISELDEKQSVMFLEGLFAHELMHQIATDFPNFSLALEKLSKYEAPIFSEIYNVMEDPAIEYQAPCFFGGHLLNSLSFMIMHVYKKCKDFSKAMPFNQFLAALNHYGNGGLLKGSFSSNEAKKCFYEVLPLFDKAIEEPNGKMRIHYAMEVFEKSRCLWAPIVENAEAREKLLEELRSLISIFNTGMSSNDGPMTDIVKDESAAGEASRRKKSRRTFTFHRINREQAKEMGLNVDEKASEGNLPEEENINVFIIEDSKSESRKSSSASTPLYTQSPSKSENDSAQTETEDYIDCDASAKKNEDLSFEFDEGEISEDEYEISKEDAKIIASTIAHCINEADKEKQTIENAFSEGLDLPEISEHYKGVPCKNIRVRTGCANTLSDEYKQLLSAMLPSINICYNQLKRIFMNDFEDKEYRANGRVNIKRLSSGRLTARVFNRRKSPANKSDVAVVMLIDESGSMRSNNKSICARNSAIGLAEVFDRLNIPISIIGFTADTQGAGAVHYHYLHWANTQSERLKLLNIQARDNNFDGYSIRYATKFLSKRKETHKILIVLSDGRPLCRFYNTGSDGIKDTADAIREATKIADVIGVAVGVSESTKNILFAMYKKSFMNVSNPEEIYLQLANKIQRIVKNW